jgi:MraZ protein
VRQWQRRLIGYAMEVDMDGAGRVLISPALREYAQLDKAVALAGVGRKFELWNKEAWDRTQSEVEPFTPGMLPPELDGFSL